MWWCLLLLSPTIETKWRRRRLWLASSVHSDSLCGTPLSPSLKFFRVSEQILGCFYIFYQLYILHSHSEFCQFLCFCLIFSSVFRMFCVGWVHLAENLAIITLSLFESVEVIAFKLESSKKQIECAVIHCKMLFCWLMLLTSSV